MRYGTSPQSSPSGCSSGCAHAPAAITTARVAWPNGDPFSSADVKYSYERTWDPKVATRVSTVFTTVERVDAPDPMTVVFTTKKPDPLLAARAAFYGGQIVPKKYLESVGADAFNAKPIGTGPVRFVSWTKDDKLVLEA